MYTLGKTLGSGAFSTVKEACHQETKTDHAVKCINRNQLKQDDIDCIMLEVSILRQLQHGNIMRIDGFFIEPKMYYLVTEKMHGGDLFDDIVSKDNYNELQARDLIRLVVNAVQYCHARNVVHRDLKPENLLLSDCRSDIKLADFGFARQMKNSNSRLTTMCGTPGYAAPEILSAVPYGPQVDMWSMGVITYLILCGCPPFAHENRFSLFEMIKRGNYEFHSPDWDDVSQPAKDAIQRMLCVNPEKRITAAELLKHEWLTMDASALRAHKLGSAFSHISAFNSRRKFVGAVSVVRSIGRINRLLRMTKAAAADAAANGDEATAAPTNLESQRPPGILIKDGKKSPKPLNRRVIFKDTHDPPTPKSRNSPPPPVEQGSVDDLAVAQPAEEPVVVPKKLSERVASKYHSGASHKNLLDFDQPPAAAEPPAAPPAVTAPPAAVTQQPGAELVPQKSGGQKYVARTSSKNLMDGVEPPPAAAPQNPAVTPVPASKKYHAASSQKNLMDGVAPSDPSDPADPVAAAPRGAPQKYVARTSSKNLMDGVEPPPAAEPQHPAEPVSKKYSTSSSKKNLMAGMVGPTPPVTVESYVQQRPARAEIPSLSMTPADVAAASWQRTNVAPWGALAAGSTWKRKTHSTNEPRSPGGAVTAAGTTTAAVRPTLENAGSSTRIVGATVDIEESAAIDGGVKARIWV